MLKLLGHRRTRELVHGSLPGRTARNNLVNFLNGAESGNERADTRRILASFKPERENLLAVFVTPEWNHHGRVELETH
jgi:hypothetical protein